MNTQNQGFNEFVDDYSRDILQLNAIHQDIALSAATDLLKASRQRLELIQNKPCSDVLILAHALLTYQQYESGHPNGFQRSMSAAMNEITDKLGDIRESIDCASANEKLAEPSALSLLSPDHALAALKERWLNLNPTHSEREYLAAVKEFEKLLGL